MEQKLTVEKLSKRYGKISALQEVSFTLHTGLYGLLGANGAGKSTLIKVITGLEKEDKGEANYWLDGKPASILEHIGYLPQHPAFYPEFTAKEFLSYMIDIKAPPMRRKQELGSIDILLEQVHLGEHKSKKIKAYSGGMKQRLGIAQALINHPHVLIFDEPTAGLDLKERIEFRNIISSLAKDRIILFATHIVSDVEHMAKEILFLDQGVLIKQATPEAMTKNLENMVWKIHVPREKIEVYRKTYLISHIAEYDHEFVLKIIDEQKPLGDAELTKATLEDYCMYVYGKML